MSYSRGRSIELTIAPAPRRWYDVWRIEVNETVPIGNERAAFAGEGQKSRIALAAVGEHRAAAIELIGSGVTVQPTTAVVHPAKSPVGCLREYPDEALDAALLHREGEGQVYPIR